MITVVKLELAGPAQIENQAKQIDGLTPATLVAEMATTEGCKVKEHRWMEKFGEWKHDYYVEQWESEDASATWDINVLEAGEYLVALEYSAENKASNSEWVLSCGDESITFITYESGADLSKDFQPGPPRQRNFEVKLGVLKIENEGLNQIEVSPRILIEGGAGLKGITLTPYK